MILKKKEITISADELAASTPIVQPTISNDSNKKVKDGIKGPEDKYYLPVLNINHNTDWETKPNSERKLFTDEIATKTCLGNCCGVEGLKGACCHLDPIDLEHVLGPLDEEWIRDTLKWFRKKGIPMSREDLVVDFEEGKILGDTLFKDSRNNRIFYEEKAYPFLRFQVLGPRYACKFMNPKTYKCQIYEIRPNMCRTYYCQYIVTNFLVKTKKHPNRWQKLR